MQGLDEKRVGSVVDPRILVGVAVDSKVFQS